MLARLSEKNARVHGILDCGGGGGMVAGRAAPEETNPTSGKAWGCRGVGIQPAQPALLGFSKPGTIDPRPLVPTGPVPGQHTGFDSYSLRPGLFLGHPGNQETESGADRAKPGSLLHMSSKTLAPLFPCQFQTEDSLLFKFTISALVLVARLDGTSSYNQHVTGLICSRAHT